MEDKQAVEETVVAEEDGSCILGQNITKAGFHGKPRIFFNFVTWISLIFLMISGVFTDIFGSKKLKTLGGIHKTRQKQN